MTHPDNNFKEKLYDLETPLGSNVSFEKVMAMRSKRPGAIWWKPAFMVVATLSAVSVAAYFMGKPAGKSQAENATENAISSTNKGDQKQTPQISRDNAGENEAGTSNNAVVSSPDRSVAEFGKSGSQKTKDNAYTNGSGKQDEQGRKDITKTDEQNSPEQPIEITETYASGADLFGGMKHWGIRAGRNAWSFGSTSMLTEQERTLEKKATNPWSYEAMIVTGSRNYKNYPSNAAYAIRGINHFGQYNINALYDLGRGFAVSAGLGYTENLGDGEWRKTETKTQMVTGSHVIKIVQPGLPDIYKTVYDTSWNTRQVTTNGNLHYHLSRINIPLGFRYHFGQGRVIWRISGSVAPGMLISNRGSMFNRESSLDLNNNTNHAFSLDSRIAFGIYMPVSRKLTFVAEPTAQYQSVFGKAWTGYNKFVPGFGVGLVFKP